jgi:hypothetical protein
MGGMDTDLSFARSAVIGTLRESALAHECAALKTPILESCGTA